MRLSSALSVGFAVHAVAVPTASIQRRDPPTPEHCVDDGKSMIPPPSPENPPDPVVGFPIKDACGRKQAWVMPREICGDRALRGPAAFTTEYRTGGGDYPSAYNMGKWFETLVGGSYDPKNPNSATPFSVLQWAAQYDKANFDWVCNQVTCEIRDGFKSECEEDYINSELLMVLESAKNLYDYLKSLNAAIESCRTYITDVLPTMYGMFGVDEIKEGAGWDKILGVLTAGAGVYASVLNTVPGAGMSSAGAALGGALLGLLLPEAEKEPKFDRASKAVAAFSSSVQVILNTVDGYIKKQFVDPIAGPEGGPEIIKFTNDTGGFIRLIQTGEFAGVDLPVVAPRDANIMASLAAPIINDMLIKKKVFVAHFRASDWTGGEWGRVHDGKHLCDESFKFFEDIQEGRKLCDPNTGDLRMLINYPSGPDYAGTARNVPGLSDLPKFNITREQIITGSEANRHNGWLKIPSPEEMMQRFSGIENVRQLADGHLNVWNLPYCFAEQPDGGNAKDIEQYIAVAALGCGQVKDQYNAPFPYKNEGKYCPRC